MDHETAKALKAVEDEKDFKTARFWGQLFWVLPIGISSGLIGLLGPIVGSILAVLFLFLCIYYKTRLIMYFVFVIGTVILAFTGATGGIFGTIFAIFIVLVGCLQNYQYVKFKKAIKAYEASMAEEQQIDADAK
ncbi:hypothetical protein ACE106_15480 [Shouchella clausii]|uniref:hypothetical protein n=1 Tax=Shouchella clausii TaxID=79880 RepID=UPI0028A165A2|nr:hypothetical protein [Shouchella clausii]